MSKGYPDPMAKTQPDEQYTPRGAKIPIPEKGGFRRNLDKLMKADQPAPKVRKPKADAVATARVLAVVVAPRILVNVGPGQVPKG